MPWTAYFSGCRVSGFGIMNGLTIWMYNVKKRTVVANMVNPKGPVTSSGTRRRLRLRVRTASSSRLLCRARLLLHENESVRQISKSLSSIKEPAEHDCSESKKHSVEGYETLLEGPRALAWDHAGQGAGQLVDGRCLDCQDYDQSKQ